MHGNRVIPEGCEAQMCDLYREGKTLREIGILFGVSRERIRQIISALGVTRKDGGQTIGANETRARKKAEKERLFRQRAKRLGMPHTELRKHLNQYGSGSKSPLSKYRSHRQAARKRGIGWKFNFGSWWKMWSESGKWALRGRGKYVMARSGDEGPYAVENVYICTASQNSKDAHVNKPYQTRTFKIGSCKKITKEKYADIREDPRPQSEIAKHYGVHQSTISLIKNYKVKE